MRPQRKPGGASIPPGEDRRGARLPRRYGALRYIAPMRPLPSLLATLILASSVASAEEPPPLRTESLEPEAPPADLAVIEARADPVRDLLATIASPRMSETQGQAYFDQLVGMGTAALTTLAQVYGDPTSPDDEVWVAARALGHIGGDVARRALLRGLESPRIIERLGAVSGLQLMADKDTAPALERALFDKAMTVRSTAADALADIGHRESYKALIQALNQPSNYKDGQSLFVREHIIRALGDVGSIGGIETLIAVLDEPEPPMRLASVLALARITGKSFRDPAYPSEHPPEPPEIDAWRRWWSERKARIPVRE